MYPRVIDEHYTIAAILSGHSIARFGDGEIKLIMGHNCVSQKHCPDIQQELAMILRTPSQICLTGIMNLNKPTAKDDFWEKYKEHKRAQYFNLDKQYYSSFISRPDSVPEINTHHYWADVEKIWRGKKIILVSGGRSSALDPDTMSSASSIIEIQGPETDAYKDIDDLENEIKSCPKDHIVILCLGPTATCLAWRLAHADIHALDLGHIGLYYRRFTRGEPVNGTKKHIV